ncbi:MAG: phosphatidylcholine/phosphatidylserine synthase [Parvibaculaceae bacterium]
MSMPESDKPLRYYRRRRDGGLFRFKRIPVRFLLPNLITLLALCAGLTAIRLGFEGRYELAVGAIIFAIVMDAIDGRLARFLKGASKFGAELDSLCDFVNFGVAPAVLLYMWSLHDKKNLGWIVALALAVCCALRLARFNVAIDDPDKPAWMSGFFTGIPAPAGAGLALVPFYMAFLGIITDGEAAAPFILPYVALVAVGMVSRVPTFAGKGSGGRVSRELVLPILAALVGLAVLLIAFTWEVLLAIATLYIALIPFGIRSYARQKRAWEERKAAQEPSPEPV